MNGEPPRTPASLVGLLGATVVFLMITIVAGYLTRLSLARRATWVEHTDEVALAIDDCRLYLQEVVEDPSDAGAVEGLKRGEERVRELTVDNPRQQERLTRAQEIGPRLRTATAETAPEVRSILSQMAAEEGALLASREADLEEARDRSSTTFAAGGLLTLVFGGLSILLLQRQARGLALAHRDLHRDQALLKSVVESVTDAVLAVDALGGFIVVNQAARKILGLRPPHDRRPADILKYVSATLEDGSEMTWEDGPLARTVRGETIDRLVYQIIPRAEGARATWVSVSGRSVRDAKGLVAAGVVTMHDITDVRLHAAQLSALSLTDELTRLNNRRGFLVLAEQHLRAAARSRKPFALLFADLNGLKRINDELGHELGDRAICDAADVLRSVFRDSDIIARLGGDEFVVLLTDTSQSTTPGPVERLREAIRAHNDRGGLTYRVSMSMGVSFYDPERPQSLQDLLAEADQRMYASKRARQGASVPVMSAVPKEGATKGS
jgi:diguanylate cyclase (GGDEF)-like protein/PAS domain S-box-containing protein